MKSTSGKVPIMSLDYLWTMSIAYLMEASYTVIELWSILLVTCLAHTRIVNGWLSTHGNGFYTQIFKLHKKSNGDRKMAHTSSKIKIGAFFNNALAIAILCRHQKILKKYWSFIYFPWQTGKLTPESLLCTWKNSAMLQKGSTSISSFIYGAYLALTTTKKTSSLSYHSIVALQSRFFKVLRPMSNNV